MTDFEGTPKIDALEQPIEAVSLRSCPKCGLTVPGSASHCPQDGFELSEPPSSDPEFCDRYEIQELIGKGGMSVVYKAEQKLLHKTVAIKMLHPHLTTDDRNAMRFQREGKAISKLDHPNIVKIHDFGFSAGGQPYMVMDFLKGNSLSELIAENGYLELPLTINIFEQICDALAHAHEHGVLHRDLKPSNIIISQDKFGVAVKLVDFGIAKIMEREGEESKQITQTGEIFGSPSYMSPEQCKGMRFDERCDIYSLGCILFECLTGRPPHQASTPFETMLKHVNEKAPLLSEARPDLQFPPRLDAFASKLLAVDAKQRYRSMNAVLSDLENLKKSAAQPQGLWTTSKNRIILGAAALAATLCLVLVVVVLYFQSGQHQTSISAPTKLPPSQGNAPEGMTSDIISKLAVATKIDLHKSTLTDSWMPYIASYKNITSLDLTDTAITDSGVAELAGMPMLHSLALNHTGITNKSMATVAALPALTVFEARGTDIDDEGVKLLAGAKKLREIVLPEVRITGKALKDLGLMQSLQILDLYKDALDDSGIGYLQNRNLKDLRIGKTGITNRAGAQLSNLTSLTKLYLSDNAFGDSGLAKIANLSHLTLLALGHTAVTDAGIKHLEHLPIARLDLKDTRVTDKCINSILAMEHLVKVDLGGTDITDTALDLLQKAKRLNELEIYRTHITDAGLQYVGKMGNLEYLDLCHTSVSDVGLNYLNDLNKLRKLKVRGCKKISRAAIYAFKNAHPKCKDVEMP